MNRLYDENIDKLKGFGILLTVVGHSGGPLSSIIYLFHMPLFYFLSGYTFKESNADNIIFLVKKRLKSLYIPFIKYSLLFILLHNIFVKFGLYDNSLLYDKSTFKINLIKNFLFINTEQLLGAFWFLTSLFFVNIMYGIIFRFLKGKNIEYMNFIIILLFILNITIFTKDIIFNLSIADYYFLMFRISCSGIVFFHMGYICNKYKILKKINTHLLYFIISIIYLYINTTYGSISMGGNNYGSSPTFFIFNAIIGIYVSYCVIKYVVNENIEKMLIFIGKNTLPILALHMLAFKIINYIQIKIYNYPSTYLSAFPYISGENGWWIIYSVIGITLPCVYVLIEKKIIKNIYKIKLN